MAVNWAIQFGVQLVAWSVSACLIVALLPFVAAFWLWNAVTDFSTVVKRRQKEGDPGGSRISRKWGASRFLQLKDVSIHYVEAGDRSNPLMLCLHGFPEFWFSWRHQLKEFRSTHWVVAVDLRGYGKSDKPGGVRSYKMDRLVDDVRGIIRALGRNKCDVLLAHDWGAGIGWNVVYRHPELVSRFVPMNCPHPAAFVQVISSDYRQIFKSWYMIFFQFPRVPELIMTAFGAALFRRVFQLPGDVQSPEIGAYLELYRRPGDLTAPMNYYRNMTDVDMMGVEQKMHIKVPTLLIWGTDDCFLSESMARLSAKWADDLTLALISGASHWVQQDAPDSVNQHVRRFVQSA